MHSNQQHVPLLAVMLLAWALLTTCRAPQSAHQPSHTAEFPAPSAAIIGSPEAPTHAPPRVVASLPTREPTYLPKFILVCPSIPAYPFATRIESHQTNGDHVRISTYQTRSAGTDVQAWFDQHLATAGWRYNGISGYYGTTYLHRQADEYNPSISLAIRFVTDEPPTVVYVLRLLIDHPHREAHWCPDLVP